LGRTNDWGDNEIGNNGNNEEDDSHTSSRAASPLSTAALPDLTPAAREAYAAVMSACPEHPIRNPFGWHRVPYSTSHPLRA